MLKKDFIEKMNEIGKGEFVNATWQSEKLATNGKTYRKVSNGNVRFVNYANISSVVVKGKTNQNETKDSECMFLYHNANTGNDMVQISTIKGQKPKCNYYEIDSNGNPIEIDKTTYETNVPPRKPQLDSNGNPIETIVFRVLLQNLLKLGK